MTETPRIRWEETEAGILAGYVGTVGPALFFTWQPPQRDPLWVLTTDLPGMAAERRYKDNPEELKAEAEQWLSEFVASLGALSTTEEAATAAGSEADRA